MMIYPSWMHRGPLAQQQVTMSLEIVHVAQHATACVRLHVNVVSSRFTGDQKCFLSSVCHARVTAVLANRFASHHSH